MIFKEEQMYIQDDTYSKRERKKKKEKEKKKRKKRKRKELQSQGKNNTLSHRYFRSRNRNLVKCENIPLLDEMQHYDNIHYNSITTAVSRNKTIIEQSYICIREIK